MKTFHIRIIGNVQGVFFRAYTQRKANIIGARGWVRNREDGSVEAKIQGNDKQIEEMILALRKGSAHSEVKDLKVTEIEEENYSSFDII